MREIIERHAENMAASGITLPRLRFFKPVDKFWDTLTEVIADQKIKMVVDCGTGNGELPKEARLEHDIHMAGIDIVRREGNDYVEVHILAAHQMPCDNKTWRMACRPDHSGWVSPLVEKSLEEGSGFIYVGLPKNVADDLGQYIEHCSHETFSDVGEDGEMMVVFTPV